MQVLSHAQYQPHAGCAMLYLVTARGSAEQGLSYFLRRCMQ